MDSRRRNRQLLLFLSTILIPATALISVGALLVRQETELAEKRGADQRRDAIEQLRRELSARLETIKLQAAGGIAEDWRPEIVFIAPLDRDRMILPWEDRATIAGPSAEFLRHRREGESREFVANDPEAAAQAYRQAMNAARRPVEKCESKLLMARALSKGKKSSEASRIYVSMMKECESAADSDGIVYGLYAAERLTETQQHLDQARQYILREAGTSNWTAPTQAYLLRSLLSGIPGAEARQAEKKLSSEIRAAEQVLALARDLHRPLIRLELPFGSRPLDSVWLAYGDEPWLITVTSTINTEAPIVLAVSSKKISPPGVTLLAKHSSTSAPIGGNLIDLEVEWPADRFAAPAVPAALYAAGLALILFMIVFAGYLLLRDVNRQVQIAEMRSHFVAGVSHELKTPLTAIRMFADTLAMGRSTDEGKKAEYLQTIVNESERLSRLVDNVLDFSRIERGKKIYRMEPLSLAEVVRSAARAMQYPLAQQGFNLEMSIDDNLPMLPGDADALQQAVLNLLTNAMKYSGESRQIDLRLRRLDRDAAIEVTDRGLGIDGEDQKRIFEKFYRVRSARTDSIAGTGLGLTLAMHIVKSHGGRLDVSSTPGHGSTFSLLIPLNRSEAPSVFCQRLYCRDRTRSNRISALSFRKMRQAICRKRSNSINAQQKRPATIACLPRRRCSEPLHRMKNSASLRP